MHENISMEITLAQAPKRLGDNGSECCKPTSSATDARRTVVLDTVHMIRNLSF